MKDVIPAASEIVDCQDKQQFDAVGSGYCPGCMKRCRPLWPVMVVRPGLPPERAWRVGCEECDKVWVSKR
jgi:hypothetical protein